MSLKVLCQSLFVVATLGLSGCNDKSGNSAPSPFTGYWVSLKEDFSQDPDGNSLGIFVSEEGELSELSLDESKEGVVFGKVTSNGRVGFSESFFDEMKLDPKVEIKNFEVKMTLINENQMSIQVLAITGTYDGEPLEMGSMPGEPSVYERTSKDGLLQLKTKRQEQIQNSEELIQSLIGTSWELEETHYKRTDLMDDNSDVDYEYTEAAKDTPESRVFGGWTYHNFKTIKFASESELEINGGKYISSFIYHPLKGLEATSSSRAESNEGEFKNSYGVISVEGDKMTMTRDEDVDYLSDQGGEKKQVKYHHLEIRTYKRIE